MIILYSKYGKGCDDMAKKESTERKHFDDMSFFELDKQALFEHATQIEDAETAIKAVNYILELENETVEFDEDMKENERKKLRKKTRKVRNKETNKFENTGELLYPNEASIENKIRQMGKTVKKHSTMTLKAEYCRTYWEDKIPENWGKEKPPKTTSSDLAKKALELIAKRSKRTK